MRSEKEFISERRLQDLTKKVVESYLRKNQKIEEWLEEILKQELTEKNEEEIKEKIDSIIDCIKLKEKNYKDIKKNRELGVSVNNILEKEIAKNILGECLEEVKDKLKDVSENFENGNISKIYDLSGRNGEEIVKGLSKANELKILEFLNSFNNIIKKESEKNCEFFKNIEMLSLNINNEKKKKEKLKYSFENRLDVRALSNRIAKQAILYGSLSIIQELKREKYEKEKIVLEGMTVEIDIELVIAILAGLVIWVEKESITEFGIDILGTVAFSAILVVEVCKKIGSSEVNLKTGLKDINNILCFIYCDTKKISEEDIRPIYTFLSTVIKVLIRVIGFFSGVKIKEEIYKGLEDLINEKAEKAENAVYEGLENVKLMAIAN